MHHPNDTAFAEEAIRLLRRLATLRPLSPPAVATLLGRRLDLLHEDPYQFRWQLGPGVRSPFVGGSVLELRRKRGCDVWLRLPATPELPLLRCVQEFGSPPHAILSDVPRSSEALHAVGYCTGNGEVRFLARQLRSGARVESVIVSNRPSFRWPGILTPSNANSSE